MSQSVLDAISDAFCLVDLQGRVVLCNQAFATLVGRTPGDVAGQECVRLVHGTATAPPECPLVKALNARAHDAAEIRLGDRWVREVAHPVLDEGGALAGAVLIISDITEHARAEQSLRESEERFRTTVANFSDGLVLIDEDARVIEWNAAVERMFGITREQALGKPVWEVEWDVYPPERKTPDRFAQAKESVLRAVRHGDLPELRRDVTVRSLDGTVRTVQQSVFRIRTDRGYRIGTVYSDITDREQAEQALRESEQRYRALFENSLTGIFRSTTDGRLLQANEALARMLGFATVQEMLAAPVRETYATPGDRDEFLAAIRAGGSVQAREVKLRKRDGSPLWAVLTATLVPDESGKPTVIEGTLVDISERKRSEEALQLFKRSTDIASDAAFWHDRSGRFTYVNEAACSSVGYSRDELLTMHLPDVNPRAGPDRLAKIWEMLRTQRTISFESAHRRKDGTEFPVEIVATYVELGDRQEVCGFARDITERKRAQEALAASEERYRLIATNTSDGIFSLDLAGRITFASPRWLKRGGYGEADVIGHSMIEFIPSEHRAMALENFSRALRGEDIPVYEIELLASDGTREPVELRMSNVTDAEGRIVARVGVFRDIAERRKTEEALRSSAATLKALLDATSDAALLIDPDGTILAANETMATSLGRRVADVLGRSAFDFLPSEVASARKAKIDDVRRLRQPVRFEDETLGLRFENSVIPVVDAHGNVRSLAIYARDITEQRKLEDQLRQAQKMEAVGSLAAGVAHDFNNLLQAMLSRAQALRGQPGDHEKVTEASREFEELIRRGAWLTRQLLLFSRREAAQPMRLDLNAVVQGVVRLLERLVPANVTLTVETAAGSLPVDADRAQLEQVLINLAVNACDAMPEGGSLSVRVGAAGEQRVWLEVADTGTGIPEAIRDRIFEPFFTTKEADKGTGLGLSVVHGIVTRHGGTISVADREEKGTVFRIELSRAQTAPGGEAKAQPRADEPPLGGGERVLVVEDEEAARKALVDLLTMLRYDVTGVASAEDAGRLPTEPPFHLLLTDLSLPGASGSELARGLQARWRRLKVIVMSGYAEDEALRRGVSGGWIRFLQKPFDVTMLARELRAALDERDEPRGV